MKLSLQQYLALFTVIFIEKIINAPFFIRAFFIIDRFQKKITELKIKMFFFKFWCKSESKKILKSRSNLFKGLNVAFICDGNRRYLKRYSVDQDFVKNQGILKIKEIIEFGYKNKINELSFFCFAIKNFSRPKKEIDELMNLVKQNADNVYESSIKPKFKIYGRLDLLENDVREKLVKLEKKTEENSDIIVNIFFAYSSEDEILRGGGFEGKVDLLIRSSGEKRISDFMLKEVASGTHIFFANSLWPELTMLGVYLILFKHIIEIKYLNNNKLKKH